MRGETAIHAGLLGAFLIGLFVWACYGEPQRDPDTGLTDSTVAAAKSALCDAGLCDGLPNIDSVSFAVMPGTDGYTRAPTASEADAGFTGIYEDAYDACPRHSMPHVIHLPNIDFSDPRTRELACHGLGHVARGCYPDDHAYFAAVSLDAKCREATRNVRPLSGASGDSQ